jgi:phosphate-selective porin OprO/OprP
VVLVLGSVAQAQTDKPASIYDRIWKFAEWYDDDSNPVVQKVLFSGRFHQDFVVLNSDQGDVREANLRRLRFGPRVTLFKTVTAHAEVELNPQERNPVYMRFTDLYVQWARNTQFVVTVGKQALPFTQEGATSSRELLTIDRSSVGNNIWFPQEYLPGVSVSGRRAAWNYRGGLYSTGAANRELGEFNGGLAALGVLGYDFAKAMGVKEALLTGHYVYQHPDSRNTFARQLEHVGSINFRLETSRWGLRTDVAAGSGYLGQPGLTGVMVMPFINMTDRLQLVGRYTFLDSDGANGIRLAAYESRVVAGRGERHDEVYAGINYYFYGHKLKLQSGVQTADMSDRANDGGTYSGVSWTTGIRVGW